MKLLTYTTGMEPKVGALADDQVVDLVEASQGRLPADMRRLLAQGDQGLDLARSVADNAVRQGQGIPLQSVKILAPLLDPPKIVAIGLNYMDHCLEQNVTPPQAPMIFTKFPSSIIGPEDTIRWDPNLTRFVDYEAELAVVIGQDARNVSQADALNYVAGYMNCNDVSARDLQKEDGQWVRGKSLDTFCPFGPYLVTRDEIADPNKLAIRCLVNGQVLQDSNTDKMIFDVPYLIEYLSRSFSLFPGDVIVTGTPHGVGVFRSPRVSLHDGDEVTVEVEGLGQLTNKCVELS